MPPACRRSRMSLYGEAQNAPNYRPCAADVVDGAAGRRGLRQSAPPRLVLGLGGPAAVAICLPDRSYDLRRPGDLPARCWLTWEVVNPVAVMSGTIDRTRATLFKKRVGGYCQGIPREAKVMSRICWRSFFLGAASCGLLLLVVGGAMSVSFAYRASARRALLEARRAQLEAEAAQARAEERRAQFEAERQAFERRQQEAEKAAPKR